MFNILGDANLSSSDLDSRYFMSKTTDNDEYSYIGSNLFLITDSFDIIFMPVSPDAS